MYRERRGLIVDRIRKAWMMRRTVSHLHLHRRGESWVPGWWKLIEKHCAYLALALVSVLKLVLPQSGFLLVGQDRQTVKSKYERHQVPYPPDFPNRVLSENASRMLGSTQSGSTGATRVGHTLLARGAGTAQ